MTESQHDYEQDIRKLMEDLTADNSETASKSVNAEHENERKGAVRLSGAPVATSLSDLPLVLGDVAYSPSEDLREGVLAQDVQLVLSADDTVSEAHEDDFNEDAFIEQYLNAQLADKEAGGYDDACRASFFGRQIFRRGDTPLVVVGKCVFWLLMVAIAAALVYGTYVLGVQPLIAAQQEQQLAQTYDPDAVGTVGENESGYPKGMLASFRGLYDLNPQVSGYIQYHATSEEDFLQIDYPVVYAGDNTTYRNQNFTGSASADGALFVDERCDGTSPVTIIYGNNPTSGKMFAGLNSLVRSVYSARAAARLTYSTLYEKSEYRVFAVVLTDTAATGAASFDCCRADFSSDEELNTYLDAVMARSLFDYDVAVSASDDILVLVTDASPSVAKIGNARIAVYARRVRGDDSTSLVVKNDDVIMPLAWYTAQNIKPHHYYTAPTTTAPIGGNTTTVPDSGTTTTSPTGGTTVPSDDETQSTTAVNPSTTPSSSPVGGGDDGVIEMEDPV